MTVYNSIKYFAFTFSENYFLIKKENIKYFFFKHFAKLLNFVAYQKREIINISFYKYIKYFALFLLYYLARQ